MISMKFGGTSMGSAENIKKCAEIILKKKNKTPVVVVSAMTCVTDKLLAAEKAAIEKKIDTMIKICREILDLHFSTIDELIGNNKNSKEAKNFVESEIAGLENFLSALSIILEISPASRDKILAIGEKLSAKILAEFLKSKGEKSEFFNFEFLCDRKVIKKTNEKKFFDCLRSKIKKTLDPALKNKTIPICTGFFGQFPSGIIAAVGRGYSDFCAAIVGETLKAKKIEIWTDVDGILSADPRIVENPIFLDEISFAEAAEMASFGAKVIHPKTIYPAVKENIPVWIKNTFNPDFPGTLISRDGKNSNKICKSITAKKNISVITILSSEMSEKIGFLADVFSIFKKYEIGIDIVATSENSFSATVEKKISEIKPLLEELTFFGKILTIEDQAIVGAIGNEMGEKIGTGAKFLETISKLGINANIISRDATKNSIFFVVENSQAEKVIQKIHSEILE